MRKPPKKGSLMVGQRRRTRGRHTVRGRPSVRGRQRGHRTWVVFTAEEKENSVEYVSDGACICMSGGTKRVIYHRPRWSTVTRNYNC